MLAFNLGVFFRNLAGAEVEFTAKNPQCDLRFIGTVRDFRREQDVGTRLSVALNSGALTCAIGIEEDEALDTPEAAKVDVTLLQQTDGGERELLRATFRFEHITLKPYIPAAVAEAEPQGEPPPKAS